jgi:glycosyltransferase involved in cell wall biosynthesis
MGRRPMRILMGILSELSHERRQERMVESLERAGHQVSATWVDNGEAPLSDFWKERPLHRLQASRALGGKLYFLRFMGWFHRLILQEKPHAVLAVDPPALGPALRARASRPFHLVYDAREYWSELPTVRSRPLMTAVWKWTEGRGMRQADASCAVCASIARALQEDYHLSREVAVVRNVPALSWRPREATRRHQLGRLWPTLGQGPVVVYAGGFWPGYDFRPLMDAVGLLEEKGRGVNLLMLGDGPQWELHRRHASTLPWKERVLLAGKVPGHQLDGLLRGCDAGTVMVPDLGLSYRYLLPNKLFEYIQAGLPVLASPLPETASVVLGRGLGRCADPQNAAAIAAQLTILLDPARESTWQAALEAAAQDLCWEKEESRFLQLFTPQGGGALENGPASIGR